MAVRWRKRGSSFYENRRGEGANWNRLHPPPHPVPPLIRQNLFMIHKEKKDRKEGKEVAIVATGKDKRNKQKSWNEAKGQREKL
jgi:hypothetical protein